MWPYWLVYIIPAWFSLKFPYQSIDYQIKSSRHLWAFCCIFLVLMIGYRYEVGGDWDSYYFHVISSRGLKLTDLDLYNEPLFTILAWIGSFWGDIYIFNLCAGIAFCYGLFRLCGHFHRPWLCLAIAIPYLLIVVAMGYSRQAGALGAFMLALLYLENGNVKKYLIFIIIGSAFHKSIILMSVLGIIKKKSFSVLNLIVIIIIFWFFWLLLQKYFLIYYKGYVVNEYNSSGAYIRALLNVLPASIYLFLRDKFRMFSQTAHRIYLLMSLMALFGFIGLFFSNASTAIDRMSLYLLPLQFIIFGNLPDVFGKNGRPSRGWILNILVLYAIVEYVWLFKSDHSKYWLPYKFYLWEILW